MALVEVPAAVVSVGLQDNHFLMFFHFAVGSRYCCVRKQDREACSLQLEQQLSTEFSGQKEVVVRWARSVSG